MISKQFTEHYRVSSFHSVFSVYTEINYFVLVFVRCELKQKILSGKADQTSFLLFVSNSRSNLSSIHALDVVDDREYMMHRCSNIKDDCDEFCRRAVCGRTKTLEHLEGKTPLLILLTSERHRCPHIKHQVWISLRVNLLINAAKMRRTGVKTAYKEKMIMLASLRNRWTKMLYVVTL